MSSSNFFYFLFVCVLGWGRGGWVPLQITVSSVHIYHSILNFNVCVRLSSLCSIKLIITSVQIFIILVTITCWASEGLALFLTQNVGLVKPID